MNESRDPNQETGFEPIPNFFGSKDNLIDSKKSSETENQILWFSEKLFFVNKRLFRSKAGLFENSVVGFFDDFCSRFFK